MFSMFSHYFDFGYFRKLNVTDSISQPNLNLLKLLQVQYGVTFFEHVCLYAVTYHNCIHIYMMIYYT